MVPVVAGLTRVERPKKDDWVQTLFDGSSVGWGAETVHCGVVLCGGRCGGTQRGILHDRGVGVMRKCGAVQVGRRGGGIIS